MNDNEKVYRNMSSSGVLALVSGILMIVCGVTCGILSIISSRNLFSARKQLTI